MMNKTIPPAAPSMPAHAAPALAPLRRAFDLCVRKTRRNIHDLADAPRSWSNAPDGRYETFDEGFFDIGNWTSSFFTGMALLAWRQTGDPCFLEQTLRLAPVYREKVFVRWADTHHDLGFLYTLFSVALYQLTHDPAHREVGLRAADVLYQRFNPTGNFIRAWGRRHTTEQDNLAIIDCLMNLPLLHWAARESGDARFRDAAVRHADTARKYFIRPDDSVYHAFRFDLQTGAPLGPDNYCGRSVESHWARGAAWAIYGFALSHRHTGDAKHLDAALRLARKFIAQLDEAVVPVWDFRLPPDEPRLRDASAAAIAACGFQELQRLNAADDSILNAKHVLLQRLCRDESLDFDESRRGVLRNGQVGDNGPGSAKNAFTSWGDYFLMEALARELFHAETWW